MRYTSLRSFHAVASAGGFTAAANELNISQPTLTDAGRSRWSANSASSCSCAAAGASSSPRRGRGLLAITTPAVRRREGGARLSRTVARAAHRPPRDRRGRALPRHRDAGGVPTHAIPASMSRYRSAIHRRRCCRICSTTASTWRCSRTSIPIERLLADPATAATAIVVFCPARSSPSRGGARIRLRDLEGERMIVREAGSTTRRAFTAALKTAPASGRSIVMEIGSRESIREAVAHGIGIGRGVGRRIHPRSPHPSSAGGRRGDLHLRPRRLSAGAAERAPRTCLPHRLARFVGG